MADLERAIFELWGDVTSTENRVPPPVTSSHLLWVTLSLPLWGDVIYGWFQCTMGFRLCPRLFKEHGF